MESFDGTFDELEEEVGDLVGARDGDYGEERLLGERSGDGHGRRCGFGGQEFEGGGVEEGPSVLNGVEDGGGERLVPLSLSFRDLGQPFFRLFVEILSLLHLDCASSEPGCEPGGRGEGRKGVVGLERGEEGGEGGEGGGVRRLGRGRGRGRGGGRGRGRGG